MTDEQRVKAKWPDALAIEYAGAWQIGSASYSFPVMPPPGVRIPRYLSSENCETELAAWKDAALKVGMKD